MNVALAVPARRISDLLSSGLEGRAKSRREAMDKPRTDPDQELVKRTQAGDAVAFDELVVKYTPRLYGLVYNMTDRKSTRLNSSHPSISYAVFCLKKKKSVEIAMW